MAFLVLQELLAEMLLDVSGWPEFTTRFFLSVVLPRWPDLRSITVLVGVASLGCGLRPHQHRDGPLGGPPGQHHAAAASDRRAAPGPSGGLPRRRGAAVQRRDAGPPEAVIVETV